MADETVRDLLVALDFDLRADHDETIRAALRELRQRRQAAERANEWNGLLRITGRTEGGTDA